MSGVRDLIARASACGLTLSAHTDGAHLCVRSASGEPVPLGMRDELTAQKTALLAYFQWRDEALDIICAAMNRLADCYPIGCPTGSPDWRQADAALDAAYWSGDLAALRTSLADYERFALERFATYRSEVR
jgi:hypothetical protein